MGKHEHPKGLIPSKPNIHTPKHTPKPAPKPTPPKEDK